MLGVGLQVGDAGAWAQSVFGTLRPAASRRLPVRMGAITNREIPHDHGTQSGQRRSGDFLEGITASGRRPARMGAPVKSPDVGVFVRPGRLPARTGMTVATERALWFSLRHLQVAQNPLQSFLVGVMVLPSTEIADVAVVAQLAGPCFGRFHHNVIEAMKGTLLDG